MSHGSIESCQYPCKLAGKKSSRCQCPNRDPCSRRSYCCQCSDLMVHGCWLMVDGWLTAEVPLLQAELAAATSQLLTWYSPLLRTPSIVITLSLILRPLFDRCIPRKHAFHAVTWHDWALVHSSALIDLHPRPRQIQTRQNTKRISSPTCARITPTFQFRPLSRQSHCHNRHSLPSAIQVQLHAWPVPANTPSILLFVNNGTTLTLEPS